eukprot:m.218411 g.218411  ORF g.218411 m.218411 type:complete len:98 (+) comp39898_c0_seq2:366-659(+)
MTTHMQRQDAYDAAYFSTVARDLFTEAGTHRQTLSRILQLLISENNGQSPAICPLQVDWPSRNAEGLLQSSEEPGRLRTFRTPSENSRKRPGLSANA